MSTKSARGMKRTCQACETRFYDLNRSPITCPSCGATFLKDARESRRVAEREAVEDEVPVAAMARLGAGAGAVAAITASAEDLPEIVSVDDAMPEIEGEDDEIEASGEEDTFLEEEEEGDDVGNLIDNPIEGDEEQA
jgi:uncharacterized protein (TIGR02300 family)